MKLTKKQIAYLRSAIEHPDGQTVIFADDNTKLVKLGLFKHEMFGICKITEAGRNAMKEGR